MEASEKIVTEALNTLHDLQHEIIELLKYAPNPKSNYGIDKKAWIEEYLFFKESNLK